MSDNVNMLNEVFNQYYNKAKREHEKGNLALAKRNYLLAAEALMKIAKTSTNQLQKAQFDRAKRLIELSENLDAVPRKIIAKPFIDDQKEANKEDVENTETVFKSAKIPDIKFADIAGLHDVKKAINTRMINPLKYPEKYKIYGKKSGGGVLLFGPSGTGKTMIAKAIANEVGATFYVIKGSDIVSKWVGESEKNINALFEQAKQDKLAIIFLDEMDSLFGARGVDVHNDRRVNEFLQQMDGFVGKNPNLLLLGATNRPWDVDSAATRSGRFSEKIYVPLPDYDARKFMLIKYTGNVPLSDDINFDKLSELTGFYSGADIEELCDRAKDEPLSNCIKSGEITPLVMKDYIKAMKYVVPSVRIDDVKKFETYTQKFYKNIQILDYTENYNDQPKDTDIDINMEITLPENDFLKDND